MHSQNRLRPNLGGRLIGALKGLMDTSEALSVVIGERGPAIVVGHVGGNGRNCIYLWSGERRIVVMDNSIRELKDEGDRVTIFGDFEGGVMLFRRYYRNVNRGMIAATRVGGEAGWLCDVIERMVESVERGECVVVTCRSWEGEQRKLQWFEYDERNGEVVLMAGRLDMLKSVRLRSDRLGEAETFDGGIVADGLWGERVTVMVGNVCGPQQRSNEEGPKGMDVEPDGARVGEPGRY